MAARVRLCAVMRITFFAPALLLLVPCFGGDNAEKSGEPYEFAVIKTAKAARDVADTTISDVFKTVIIAAGKSVSLDSTMDYTSAAGVAVTVQCIICGTLATSLTGSGLALQARWMVLNAESYVATESKAASGFPFWDSGAALFNVYGSQFRLTLQNKGTQNIALQQVTIMRR